MKVAGTSRQRFTAYKMAMQALLVRCVFAYMYGHVCVGMYEHVCMGMYEHVCMVLLMFSIPIYKIYILVRCLFA